MRRSWHVTATAKLPRSPIRPNFFERGLQPFEVLSITGHSSADMLKRYTHYFAETLAVRLG
jgi:hypothetical protein